MLACYLAELQFSANLVSLKSGDVIIFKNPDDFKDAIFEKSELVFNRYYHIASFSKVPNKLVLNSLFNLGINLLEFILPNNPHIQCHKYAAISNSVGSPSAKTGALYILAISSGEYNQAIKFIY